jgi:hypothetical protein
MHLGRYKSVLMAARDAREFPHHVDVPVPGNGLGKQIDRMADWLRRACGAEWRSHGESAGGLHVVRYMFRTRTEAEQFDAAWRAGTFYEPPPG